MDASARYQDTLPVSSDALVQMLRTWGIPFEYFEHVPLKTVADSKGARDGMLSEAEGGGHIKNLFVRDKKKRNFLAVMREDREVDLKLLAEAMGAGRLSFGSAERLMECLGVRPGAVTPLAMVTGVRSGVELFLDASLRQAALIYVHPLVNDRTLSLTPSALEAFFNRVGCTFTWID